MKRSGILKGVLCAACLSMPSGMAVADAIYKHVDKQGNVTYSSAPPKGAGVVEKLEVSEQPSADEVAAARRQLQEEKQQVRAYEDERRRRDEEDEKLRREQRAREREAAAAASSAQPPGATEYYGPVYPPGWVYRPPLRPVDPWPRPDPRPSTTLPATPQPPLMAPPKRPMPDPQ